MWFPRQDPRLRSRRKPTRRRLTLEALEDRYLPASGLPAELVADIVPGVASSNPSHFVVVNNRLFFVADDGVHGPELWTSDGTATNTALVKDINPGSGGSLNPVNARLINVGRTVCF